MANKKYPVYCSWCGSVIGSSTVKNSSGICIKCAEKILKDMANEGYNVDKILDHLKSKNPDYFKNNIQENST